MNLLNAIQTVSVLVALVGCGKSPVSIPTAEVNPPTQQAPSDSKPASDSPAVSGPDIVLTTLTVYSLSRTQRPLGGIDVSSNNYTSIGYCTTYEDDVYCWDDGIHSVTENIIIGGRRAVFSNTYWNLGNDVVTDRYSAPTLVGQSFVNNEPAHSVDLILNTGVLQEVSCSVDGTILNCGTFNIDTSQDPQ